MHLVNQQAWQRLMILDFVEDGLIGQEPVK